MDERENYLRNARLQGPRWIPVMVSVSTSSWALHRNELEEVALRYPRFFPYVRKGWLDYAHLDFGPGRTKDVPFTDAWGCTWLTAINGIEGSVRNAPLGNWTELKQYRAPDPDTTFDRGPADWVRIRADIEKARAENRLTMGNVPHGFFFMRLQYLRGFENLMLDLADDEPRVRELIDMVVDHNRRLVANYLEIGVDLMNFGEDLGTQTSTIVSPSAFRKWLKPAYRQLTDPCRQAGTLVAFHSDGCILNILEDLIDSGVDIVNPQDLCNGIDNLARTIKGKVCVRLDIDRQKIIPFGTREEITELIEEEVRELGDQSGGLEFIAGIYPPTPPENVDALCAALEKYRTYWWD